MSSPLAAPVTCLGSGRRHKKAAMTHLVSPCFGLKHGKGSARVGASHRDLSHPAGAAEVSAAGHAATDRESAAKSHRLMHHHHLRRKRWDTQVQVSVLTSQRS